MILTLKQALDSVFGFRFIVDKMNILSAVGRRYLYAEKWLNDADELNNKFNQIEQTAQYITSLDKKEQNTIFHLIAQVRDIEGTIDGLMNGMILTDIEYFELKNFSLTSIRLREILKKWKVLSIPSLEQILSILDPEKTRVAAFHIYNMYDDRLSDLRNKLNQTTNESEASEIYQQIVIVEDNVRKNLATQLRPLATHIRKALKTVAILDILIAKVNIINELHLSRPEISTNNTQYIGLYNPEIKQALNDKSKDYQPIYIEYGQYPTLITGINMGGKTVILKTLYLTQTLFQFGFYVPAQQAKITLVENILLSIEDKQDTLSGLSSFAGEMTNINNIISSIRDGQNILVLIDELARTTNPTEGRAIVEAMLNFLQKNEVKSFITTHYDRIQTPCRRLRVRGLKSHCNIIDIKNIDKNIDYTLIEDNSNSVPHEALNIARLIGIDNAFIESAEKFIK